MKMVLRSMEDAVIATKDFLMRLRVSLFESLWMGEVLLKLREVETLVKEWVEERMVRELGAVTSNYIAFGDFLSWLKVRNKLDVIDPYQWISGIRQAGLEQLNDRNGLIIRGIRLKGTDV